MSAHLRILLAIEAGRGECRQSPLGRAQFHPVPKPDRVPQEGRNVVLRLTEHRLRVDRDVPVAGAEDVVVVKVAVHENIPADVERRVELAGERNKAAPLLLGALGPVEPPRHVIADPAERLRRRLPETHADLDRDRSCVVLR